MLKFLLPKHEVLGATNREPRFQAPTEILSVAPFQVAFEAPIDAEPSALCLVASSKGGETERNFPLRPITSSPSSTDLLPNR